MANRLGAEKWAPTEVTDRSKLKPEVEAASGGDEQVNFAVGRQREPSDDRQSVDVCLRAPTLSLSGPVAAHSRLVRISHGTMCFGLRVGYRRFVTAGALGGCTWTLSSSLAST